MKLEEYHSKNVLNTKKEQTAFEKIICIICSDLLWIWNIFAYWLSILLWDWRNLPEDLSKRSDCCCISPSKEYDLSCIFHSNVFACCSIDCTRELDCWCISCGKELAACCKAISKWLVLCCMSCSKQFDCCSIANCSCWCCIKASWSWC